MLRPTRQQGRVRPLGLRYEESVTLPTIGPSERGPLSARLVQNGTLKTYKGFPHGMPTTQAETINAGLLPGCGSWRSGRSLPKEQP